MNTQNRSRVAVLTNGREVMFRHIHRSQSGIVLGIVLWDGQFVNICNVDPISFA
jgi:hypothetical protein